MKNIALEMVAWADTPRRGQATAITDGAPTGRRAIPLFRSRLFAVWFHCGRPEDIFGSFRNPSRNAQPYCAFQSFGPPRLGGCRRGFLRDCERRAASGRVVGAIAAVTVVRFIATPRSDRAA